MDFGAIVNRAYQLVRQTRVLWKLGLLAVLTEGMINGFGQSFPTPPSNDQPAKADPAFERFGAEMTQWLHSHIAIAVVAGAIMLVLIILLVYLSLRAKAGLMLAVEDLETGKPVDNFQAAFRRGAEPVWRIFGLYLLTAVVVTVIAAIMFGVLFAATSPSKSAGIIAFIIMIPIFLIVVVYLNFVVKISERHIALAKGNLWQGIKLAHQLIRTRFTNSLISIAIEFGLGIIFVLAIFGIVVISIGVGAALLLVLNMIVPQPVIVVIGGILLLLLGIGIFILSGWFAAFIISYWTLVYRAFRYLVKEQK